MIILKAEAGLCNKLLAISSAMKLAKETHQRLWVWWITDMHMDVLFADLFEKVPGLRIFELNVKGRICRGIVNRIVRLLWSRFNPWATAFESESRFLERARAGKFCMHSSFREFCLDGDYSWFKPKKEIVARISEFASLAEGAVGVHIRRTDHQQAMSHSPVELFYDRIAADVARDPAIKFLLCTDDPEVKALLKARYPNNIRTREQVLARHDKGGVADGIVDLWLLSKTKKIYGTFPSSFSLVASKIGGIELEWIKK